jgi:peptidoglycan/LPS O-acetylase OafA/YrhL
MTAPAATSRGGDTAPLPSATPRRGDLDALRGFAMLLGIALHASLAYFPCPWPVQDPRQTGWLALLFGAIHGFRMPLFFLLSGFFTMLVLRRRGLRRLLEQRALRILLPLVLASATILPLDRAVFAWAVRGGVAATAAQEPLGGAILARDAAAVRRLLATGPDLARLDPRTGLGPLATAALAGDGGIVTMLLDAGAALERRNRDGSTPLHVAAFMGLPAVVELLLERGADPAAANGAGKTPLAVTDTPVEIAVLVAEFVGLPRRAEAGIEQGRRRAREILAPRSPALPPKGPLATATARYRAALGSPALALDVAGRSWQIFETNAFDHLWFLWHLCWLVAAFALATALGLGPTGRRRWWLVPASCLPFALTWAPFGPDTALGLVPTPHVLLFYACFFWFGAATFAAEGEASPLGRRWPLVLPLALVVLLPAGIATMADRPLAAVLHPAYAWGMSLGLIGLFRRCLARERPAVRWLSDASYWMYLSHLPVVVVAQALLHDRPWPAFVKFLAVLVATVAVTLVTYRWCVRFTPIGRLLNGPRSR